MIGNSVRCAARKQQAYRLVPLVCNNERSRIAACAEWTAGQRRDDDLILEQGHPRRAIPYSNCRTTVRDSASRELGRASAFLNEHIESAGHGRRAYAPEAFVERCNQRRRCLSNRAIDLIERAAEVDRDELRKLGNNIGRNMAAVEGSRLEDGVSDVRPIDIG